MTTRRGAARGTGSGYRNLRSFPKDSMVHAQAARGMKQPQRIPQSRFQINKRKTVGWNVIEYPPKFGGFKVHGVFKQKISAENFVRKKKKEVVMRSGGKAAMMPIPKHQMFEKVKSFVQKLGKDNKSSDYKISETKNYIEIATDGRMYEELYDPSISEMPYLIRDAWEEFNVPKEQRIPPNPYHQQEKMSKMLDENGWDYELDSGGIIRIYKKIR